MTTSTNEMKAMVSHDEIQGAIDALHTGGLILYPTDTVWSIGCDATDPVAIERICNLRGHRSTDDFELLFHSFDLLRRHVAHIHPRLETLLAYHVRPLTVLFDQPRRLPERLGAPIAARLVQDECCRALIAAYGAPLIATAASLHGHPYPANFGAVSSQVIEGVDYVFKYRQQDKSNGEPSVMVRLSERDELEFLRE